MAEYLSPGVYVEEFSSGIKPMEGVSTSTAGFIGMTERGPIRGMPMFVGSFGEYQRIFGGYLSKESYRDRRFLPMAVEQFFANGGSRCFVMRLLDENSSTAAQAGTETIKFTATSNGSWGNRVLVSCKKTLKKGFWQLFVAEGPDPADYAEAYQDVTLDPSSDTYLIRVLENSNLIRAEYHEAADDDLYDLFLQVPGNTLEAYDDADTKLIQSQCVLHLAGGQDCPPDKKPYETVNAVTLKGNGKDPGNRTGLCALEDVPEVSIVIAPGVTIPAESLAVIAHCEKMLNRVCILDMPEGQNLVTELQRYRMQFSSSYAAMYHPWIQVFDPLEGMSTYMPPSGALAGVYARSDNTRGVHKAPANESTRNCTGLQTLFGKKEQDMLNPVGINLIRNIQGLGIRIWGARTLSEDSGFKYINVRRLFIYIEETIRRNTAWAVFEPNDQLLWTKVRGSITVFLGTLWRSGVLLGASESEAYFVSIGRGSTMTDDDILNGRLIFVVGIAPVRPTEFVTFRITQIMEQNE